MYKKITILCLDASGRGHGLAAGKSGFGKQLKKPSYQAVRERRSRHVHWKRQLTRLLLGRI